MAARPFAVLLRGLRASAPSACSPATPASRSPLAALLAPAALLLGRPARLARAGAGATARPRRPRAAVPRLRRPPRTARPPAPRWPGSAGPGARSSPPSPGRRWACSTRATPRGWASSAADAFDGLIAPLAGADPLATGLIWIGAAVLLGLVIEFAAPAPILLLGLVWSAGLVAALGAVGGACRAVGPADAGADRRDLPARLGPRRAARPGGLAAGARRRRPAPGSAPPPPSARRRAAGGRRPRPARPPAALGDERAVATRAASRHVRAALHGAGSRAGLP